MRKSAILLLLPVLILSFGGCGYTTVRDNYDRYDPGCIQRDDFRQKHPGSAMFNYFFGDDL